jgi:hypothetical protein
MFLLQENQHSTCRQIGSMEVLLFATGDVREAKLSKKVMNDEDFFLRKKLNHTTAYTLSL